MSTCILLTKADKIEPLSINSSILSCNLVSALMRGHCNKPQTRKMRVIYIRVSDNSIYSTKDSAYMN